MKAASKQQSTAQLSTVFMNYTHIRGSCSDHTGSFVNVSVTTDSTLCCNNKTPEKTGHDSHWSS